MTPDTRTRTLEDALKALGINPDDDPIARARAWVDERGADRRERHQAVTERDNAYARISGLEAMIENTHKVFDGVGIAWSMGADAGRLHLAKRASLAVAPDMLTSPERVALTTRIADLERDLATRDASLKTAHAALTRICEVIGADPPVTPDDAVKAVAAQLGADNDAEARASKAEAELREIACALDDAGAPVTYDLADFDDAEETISPVNRILILGDYLRAEHRERGRAEGDATERHLLITAAHLALDDRNAPRRAAGRALTPAARIRALTR